MSASRTTVFPVSTASQQRAFIDFVWTHYKGDENWVPPLRASIKQLLNYKKHPFYDNAEIQTFLAMSDGQVVGRIAAIVDGWHNEYHNEKRGMFGFFECIEDQEIADQLFSAVREWLADRDIVKMRGPANPSQNYEWGLLVEGFDMPPTFLMTYNKPYYGSLIENCGFQKSQDMYTFCGHLEMLKSLDPKLDFIAEEAQRRFNFKLRNLSRKNFEKDVESFLGIYNAALPGQWGFTPMSDGELSASARGLKRLIIPELTAIAEVDDRPVGAVFGLLDYNPLIKEIDGRLFPFGFLKILLKRKQMTRIRLVSTNVLPEYQMWGLGLVLLTFLVPYGLDYGVLRTAEFSWVLESNKLSRGTLERGGALREKTHRIYDYEPS